MKILPVNFAKKTIMPIATSLLLATSAIVASSKQDMSVKSEDNQSVPSALALASLVPLATTKRKDDEKEYDQNLYNAKECALLKKDYVSNFTLRNVKAICKNDKIDVKTAKNLINIYNPSKEQSDRFIMVVNADHIKNENLPNLCHAAEKSESKTEMVEKFLKDDEINNSLNNFLDLQEIFRGDEKTYEDHKKIFKILEKHHLENDFSVYNIQSFSRLSKYITDLSFLKKHDKALLIIPEIEAAGFMERLEDPDLEKEKVEYITKQAEKIGENYYKKMEFVYKAHRQINSKINLELFAKLWENVDRFEDDRSPYYIMIDTKDSKNSLERFNKLLKDVNGSLDSYLDYIIGI